MEKYKGIIRTIAYFLAVFISIISGYVIGRETEKFKNQSIHKNPYSKIYTLNDISIAIDESNNLLLLQRKNGEYIIYSDSVGNCIFKMYANKIYTQHSNESK